MDEGLEDRALFLIWSLQPDLAIEAGRLPPTPWEPVRPEVIADRAREAADMLTELDELPLDTAACTAAYHLRCCAERLVAPDLNVLNHMTGPVGRLAWAADSWPVPADPTGSAYAERLEAFDRYSEDLSSLCRNSSAPSSRPVLESFITQVDAFVTAHGAGDGPLLKPLSGARSEAAKGLVHRVFDGLARLRTTAVDALGNAVGGSALAARADGPERYAAAIQAGTSLTATAEEIEQLGRSLLADTSARFEALLATAPRSSPPTAQEFLETATAYHDELNSRLSWITDAIPRMPCRVVEMPLAHAAVGPPAYYGPSSQEIGRPGSLYVNTAEPVGINFSDILPLAMHEGVPGHHLQIARLDENALLPATVRLLSVNAFTEGWAVYAETLATAMDLALTPEMELGLLSHQRWRAARLVIDVGLHRRGWTLDQGVEFMVSSTGLTSSACRKEVIRYLAWPGQALGYAVGARSISDWVHRRRASGIPLKRAHDELLDMGSVPLSYLGPPAWG